MIIVNLCHCGVFNPLPSVTSYSRIKLVRWARVGGTGTSEKKWTRALASASSLQPDSFNSLPSLFFENSSTLTREGIVLCIWEQLSLFFVLWKVL